MKVLRPGVNRIHRYENRLESLLNLFPCSLPVIALPKGQREATATFWSHLSPGESPWPPLPADGIITAWVKLSAGLLCPLVVATNVG